MQSLINSKEFNLALHRIVNAPVKRWKEEIEYKDIRRLKRIGSKGMRQIASGTNRLPLDHHPLNQMGLNSIPSKILMSHNEETSDTPENRFVRYALIEFHAFCSRFESKSKGRAAMEARVLADHLDSFINHANFKEVRMPDTLNLNSPVLQRKEGYREVLKAWIMFDLAAKLIWKGGDDVYEGGKRDVATLYEYWLFFTLLKLFSSVFQIEQLGIHQLIEPTKDGLGLKLKQGKQLDLEGVYVHKTRKLRIKYAFNRTFQGKQVYPSSGSWTKQMRPDYTLSVWPYGISEKDAERQELIVHIHFDAKYKVENFTKVIQADSDLDQEKQEERGGRFKNADLLKMHAYKDAIRRTAGAYVLYPGTEEVKQQGFHEIIPGLGAFAVSPSRINEGVQQLEGFIHEVIQHFMNRTSQREKMAARIYNIHQNKPSKPFEECLPETIGNYRSELPDETYVLIGYCKDEDHKQWIYEQLLYNFRMGEERGALVLCRKVVGAKYLLLYSDAESSSGTLFRITGKGPQVYSKNMMAKYQYPNPRRESYLVYNLSKELPEEFKQQQWDFFKLEAFKEKEIPFGPCAVSLKELMGVKRNEDILISQ